MLCPSAARLVSVTGSRFKAISTEHRVWDFVLAQRQIHAEGDYKTHPEGQVRSVEPFGNRADEQSGVHKGHHGTEADNQAHECRPPDVQVLQIHQGTEPLVGDSSLAVEPVDEDDREKWSDPVRAKEQNGLESCSGVSSVEPEDHTERDYRATCCSPVPLQPTPEACTARDPE